MDSLFHIGVKRRSGRYPWGSGNDNEQRGKSFLGYVEQLKKEGLSEVSIAEGLGITTSELRNRKSIYKAEQRASDSAQALRLKNKGMSNVAIGQRMGLNESSVRALLDPAIQTRSDIAAKTAKMLRDTVAEKGYIDVGAGVEQHIGLSRTKLNTSLAMLEDEGYKIYYVKTPQLGTRNFTSIKVLAPPDTPYSEVFKNRDKIQLINSHTEDSGRSWLGLKPIQHVDSKRIKINYAEEGGKDKDGVIELRRNVDDLSLGNVKYAQVRIGVDGTHFLKGMAMYNDDMPKGIDIIYNTNKTKGTPKEKVFKELKPDPDNPFGSAIKPNGQRGSLNIVNEEGDWGEWSKSISSQVLSKQTPALAKKQLGLALDLKKEQFEEIATLTNPAVKKVLLESFADDVDASSVHLKAAALPRQAAHVILPIPKMKEGEIYAPMYQNGESVVLIRHPHGGTFEIPQLTVNNKNPYAKSVMNNATDAVGIHPKVASKLSGADFDGDTVLVIPNRDGAIKTSSSPVYKALQDFDPKEAYPAYDGMPKMSPRTKQMQMGNVSNLITDMTIKGANEHEISAAVRHSMVVIDAEKHNLNYKQSAIDNNIAALKLKYQGGTRSGSSTLISKASSETRVDHRKDQIKIDPRTGEKIYEYTNESYTTTKGKIEPRTTISTRMMEEKNAFNLSSGTRMETVYATYANELKALANKSRLLAVNTKPLVYSPTAKETFANEVATLKAKLNIAYKNKPLERQAQLLANKIVTAKRQANPHMEAADLKKIKGQALEEARARTGAKKQRIEITPKEWSAIQQGAISNNTLHQILLNTDLEKVKQLAMPRTSKLMTNAKIARARSMSASGYTPAEIANALGVSTTTLQETLK